MSSSFIASSSLQSALEVLLRNDFSALDLPIDPTDPLWERIEKDFNLTLGQFSSLRNYVKNNSCCIPSSPGSNFISAVTTSGNVAAQPSKAKRSRGPKKAVKSSLLSSTTSSTVAPQQQTTVSPKVEVVKPSVVDFSRMSFEDFESMDGEVLKVIDLTFSNTEQEEEPDAKRLKTGTSSYVVVPQRIKEVAILEFLYEDRSDRLETILQSAGVTEEQYVQFPIDDRFINPERSSDDYTELSKCITSLL